MKESDLMRSLQQAASKLGARLFRQNVGLAWVGKADRITRQQSVTVKPGDVVIRNARPFHAGHAGMSDLGGWVPVVVTPDMVGQTVAIVVQAEIKTGTKASQEQRDWIAAVKRFGGRAGVARNEEELAAIIRGE